MSTFSRAVFFGDNRRGNEQERFQKLCEHSLDWRKLVEVKLLDKVVKVIYDTECEDLNKKGYYEVFHPKAVSQRVASSEYIDNGETAKRN